MQMTSNATAETRDVTETAFEGLAVGAVAPVAVVANVSLFAVVLTSRQLRNESNVLILSLSLADLLVSVVSMPLTTATIIFGTWTFTYTTCLTVGFLNMLTFTASVQSLAVISVNRYFKICRPSRFADIYTYQNVLGMCLGVWLVSGLVSMPPLLGWAAYSYLPNSYICFCEWRKSASYAFFMISFCFCLPCSAMTFCNVGILKAYVNSKKAVDSFAEKPHTLKLVHASVKRVHHGPQIASDEQKVSELKHCKERQCLVSQKVLVTKDNLGTIHKDQVNAVSSSTDLNVELKRPAVARSSCNDQPLNNIELSNGCLLIVQPSSSNSGVIFDTLRNSGGSIRVEPKLAQAETRHAEDDMIIEADVKSEAGPSQLTSTKWNQADIDQGVAPDLTHSHIATPKTLNALTKTPKPKGLHAVFNHPLKFKKSPTNSDIMIISNTGESDNQQYNVRHLLMSDNDIHSGSCNVEILFQKHQIARRRTRPGIDFYRNRKWRRRRLKKFTKSSSAKSDDHVGERIPELIISHSDQVASVNKMSVTGISGDSVKIKGSRCLGLRSAVGLDYLFDNNFTQKVRKKRKNRSIKRGVFSLVNNCMKSLRDAKQYGIVGQLFKAGKTSNDYQRSKSTKRKWDRNRITPIQMKDIDSSLNTANATVRRDDDMRCHHSCLESMLEVDDYKYECVAHKEMKNKTASLSSLNRTSGFAIPNDNAETVNIISLRPLEEGDKINQECLTEMKSSYLKQDSLKEHMTSSISQPQTKNTKVAGETRTSHLQPPFSRDTGKCLLSVPSTEKTMQESAPEKRYTFSTKSSSKSKSKSERRRMEEFQLAASLLVVILLFVVCWFPYCVSMFVVVFSPEHSSKGLDLASLCLGYFNSCLNPIVYGVMNKKFKMAYRRMLLSLLRPFRFQKNLNFAARSGKKGQGVEPVTIATVTST